MSGLYIHIPFCVRRCLYCAFYLEPLGKGPIAGRLRDHHQMHKPEFMAALRRELAEIPKSFRPATVYFGGGTPTELSHLDFEELLSMVRENIALDNVVEWSCESNPGTLTPEKITAMRRAGINRVSLGVQSFQPRVLEFLGRLHTAAEAEATFHRLRDAGFDNINLDLICNIPNGDTGNLDRDLERIVALNPDHVSCYSLEYEPGTGMTLLRDKGFLREQDDDTSEAEYRRLIETLKCAGYAHYELFNFCKPGKECVHHLNYWRAGEYYGCGPAAHSHLNGTRYENVRNLQSYIHHMSAGTSRHSLVEKLEPERKARETLMTSLRRIEGVSRIWFKDATGFDLDQLGGAVLLDLIEQGLLVSMKDNLRFSDRGLFVSSAVLAELI